MSKLKSSINQFSQALARKVLNVAALTYNYAARPRAEVLDFTNAIYKVIDASTHAEARGQYLVASKKAAEARLIEERAVGDILFIAYINNSFLKTNENIKDTANIKADKSLVNSFEDKLESFVSRAKDDNAIIDVQAKKAWRSFNTSSFNARELDLLANCSHDLLSRMEQSKEQLLDNIKESLDSPSNLEVDEIKESSQLNFSSPEAPTAFAALYYNLASDESFSPRPK